MGDYSIDLWEMQRKKTGTFRLADAFEAVADSVYCSPGPNRYGWRGKAALCRSCGTFLRFGVLDDGSSKLLGANFCKLRLCPACSFRRSLRTFANISQVMDLLEPLKYKYLFLTLTIRNVALEDLSEALSMMAKGFNRFCSNRAIKRRVLGLIRSTEVTINDKDGSIHPHYHLIVAVDSSYQREAEDYFTTEDWSKVWGKSCRLDYQPVTDIRTIRDMQGGLRETAKYAVKDKEVLRGSADQIVEKVYFLQVGLRGKRLLSYSGVFADARKQLQLSDEDTVLEDQLLRGDVLKAMVTYKWNFGLSCYDLVEVSENEFEFEKN